LRRGAVLALTAAAVEDSSKINYDPGNPAQDIVTMSALQGNETAGVRALDSVAATLSKSEPRLDRADLQMAVAYAQLGRADKAKTHLAEFERGANRDEQFLRWGEWQAARGEIALSEGRNADAIAAFRASTYSDSGSVEPAWIGKTDLRLARVFDRAGNADSAIAHFEILRQPGMRIGLSGFTPMGLVIPSRRLGELYEQKGEIAKAIERYEEFVQLWKNADPDLQPQVADIRGRIARLKTLEAKRR
jgi:tetratricopeptide (TPR) repeat protein